MKLIPVMACPVFQIGTASLQAGEELFTCYKASTSACSSTDLEDRLIRWGFPLPQPDDLQGDLTLEHLLLTGTVCKRSCGSSSSQ